MSKHYRSLVVALLLLGGIAPPAQAQIQNFDLLNAPMDISPEFRDFENTYYLADSLASFDPETASGTVRYERYEWVTRQAFNNMLGALNSIPANEFPGTEYAASPTLPFTLQFVSPRTVRIQMRSGPKIGEERESMMLVGGQPTSARSAWTYNQIPEGHEYTSEHGRVVVTTSPWQVKFYDGKGTLLTKTVHHSTHSGSSYTPVLPFSYVRKSSDYSRSYNAAFSLSPGEKIFGFGESFTEFDKRGQKVVLAVDDPNGTQNETMYKPIPFFMSSRGYGMFMHTSTPITANVGKYFGPVNALRIGDDDLDLFVFMGEPKDVLDEYTTLTGKAPMPPLWSFGFWMSRITYTSESEVRTVADSLRHYDIPSDVLHLDTGWFEVDWRSDYEFADERFSNPESMISDLKDRGLHVSLWQLPYFTPKNDLFPEIVNQGLAVKDDEGDLPYEDAVLDFSNPETVDWYQDKIGRLLEMGVGAIKVDFGEAAPYDGQYHSGRTGFYEHNLYPLRYNKAAADVTEEVHGHNFIWARSAWAGSQRYPVHWGGDAASTNTAMAATLRGGLSLGLSGFSFWSHDIGGFVESAEPNLYRRWTPFGMLSSHVRSHGTPPTEPWLYSDAFLQDFRQADNLRYRLMPYIYTQAKRATQTGLPMVRALFVEYPNDPGAWRIDDQYLFGSDIMVAPLFEDKKARGVYLPDGTWIDYQTGETYEAGWHTIAAGEIPVVMLVKEGTVLPHIDLAQSTMNMDWSALTLVNFSTDGAASGPLFRPGDDSIQQLSIQDGTLSENPYGDAVTLDVQHHLEWQ